MSHCDWPEKFKCVYDKALGQWGAGNRNPQTCFTLEELAFLNSIGAQAVELLDFAEDSRDLTFETAMLISSARREYFLFVQHGKLAERHLALSQFPPKDAELEGIRWLPRLIFKARARLRGELPAELMYCCGGDRAFFERFDIHPADFLRVVEMAGEEEGKILDHVKGRR